MPAQSGPAYDGLIFDLDGTLWDSTAPCAFAWNEVAESRQLNKSPVTHKDLGGIMGMPLDKAIEKVFPHVAPEHRESLAEECHRKEIERLRDEGGAVYPGVADGLRLLSTHYPLFIVSNCQQSYLAVFLQWSQLSSIFRDVECHGATGKSKADNIRLICARNKLKAPAYIGDTSGDQVSAGNAKVPYFHVSYGFGVPVMDCVEFKTFGELVAFFTDPAVLGKK